MPDVIPGAVTLGFLHPGHYSAVFAECKLDMFMHDVAGNQRLISHTFGQLGKECGSGGIVAGRNKLAQTVVEESSAEWLLMIDSDMGFAPDTMERLIDAADPVDRPVVGGLAFAHKNSGRTSFYGTRYRCVPTVYDYVETPDGAGFVPRFAYERDALVKCSATGGACVLIHRSALESIQAKYGNTWFDPIAHSKGPEGKPTTFSEDLSFFVRLANVDMKLFVHTGVKTTHDKGGVYYDEAFYDEQEALIAHMKSIKKSAEEAA